MQSVGNSDKLWAHSVVEVEGAGGFADFGRRQRTERHKGFERKRLIGEDCMMLVYCFVTMDVFAVDKMEKLAENIDGLSVCCLEQID